MARFVTSITLEDFVKIYPEVIYGHYLRDEGADDFPIAIAVHNEYPTGGYFGKYIGYNTTVFLADRAKHIYSTRDYWEVERVDEPGFRYKLPKDETKAVYFVVR